MKTYNKHNFFKYTYCEFTEVELSSFTEKQIHYTSKSGSLYTYTKEGVYRYSNHWGRVADCRWKLSIAKKYKNQQKYVGFAKWINFYPINEAEKLFYIKVDYELKKVSFHYTEETSKAFLFTAIEAQKRIAKINTLFTNKSWAKYFDEDIDDLRKRIITTLIETTKTLQQVKLELR